MAVKARFTMLSAAVALLAPLFVLPAASPAAAAQHEISPYVSGVVTDHDSGAVLPGACVEFVSGADAIMARACADGAGRYALPPLPVGGYRARVTAAGHNVTWLPDKPDWGNADVYVVTTRLTAPATVDAVLRAVPGGAISGRIADPLRLGGRESWLPVTATATGDGWSVYTYTRLDGAFDLAGLPAGEYRLSTTLPVTFSPATVVVASGGTAAVTGELTDSTPGLGERGVVTGRITDAVRGGGVAGAEVRFIATAGSGQANFEIGRVVTGADGVYRADNFPPRSFVLSVSAAGFPTHWHEGAPDRTTARSMFPNLTGATVIDMALRKDGGTLRGKVTAPDGTPVPAATVSLRPTDRDRALTLRTAVDGTFRLDGLIPGGYRISVGTSLYGEQWVPQRDRVEDATVIEVRAGQTTVVDEQFAPRGELEVAVVDDVTGAAVSEMCVQVGGIGGTEQCRQPGGVHRFTGLAPGLHDVYVRDGAQYLEGVVAGIRVTSGALTRTTARVVPAGSISMTFDRLGGVYPDVCVHPVAVGFAGGGYGNGGVDPYCPGSGNPQLFLHRLPVGDYQLFVRPRDFQTYQVGAQWVGAQGGTGDPRSAAVVRVTRGGTTAAPTVRMDPSGSITGFITSSATGTGVNSALITAAGRAAVGPDDWLADPGVTKRGYETGEYRIYGLGPYSWPVRFSAPGFATTWSGGVADRSRAKPVKVESGRTTRFDIALAREASVTLDLGSRPPAAWTGRVFELNSGDPAEPAAFEGRAAAEATTIGGLAAGSYAILFDDVAPGVAACWYANPGRRVFLAGGVALRAGEHRTVPLTPANCTDDPPSAALPRASRLSAPTGGTGPVPRRGAGGGETVGAASPGAFGGVFGGLTARGLRDGAAHLTGAVPR